MASIHHRIQAHKHVISNPKQALSPSGQHLALAGQRGLALYSRATRKWRLFGNVQQERELQVH